ncbi:hypothetical protein ACEXQD_17160 [Herbiconiux sp. P15]|uniref:hypothetical protein n=1 Tax=Herbiconiux liukaitaii TaxID=3342799 RepID=UPI0035BB4A23
MTTRERLDRRRSPLRLVLVLVGSLVAVLGVAAAVAVVALPPVLAETPRERIAVEARESILGPAGSASVVAPVGWVVLGVGPFLDESRLTLVSPDDAYRAEFALGDDGDDLLAAHDLTTAVEEAAWNSETLPSGNRVRWTELSPEASADPRVDTSAGAPIRAPRDDEQILTVVAFVTAADPSESGQLALVATITAADPTAYSTVTADLLDAATLAPAGIATSTPPPTPTPTSTPLPPSLPSPPPTPTPAATPAPASTPTPAAAPPPAPTPTPAAAAASAPTPATAAASAPTPAAGSAAAAAPTSTIAPATAPARTVASVSVAGGGRAGGHAWTA